MIVLKIKIFAKLLFYISTIIPTKSVLYYCFFAAQHKVALAAALASHATDLAFNNVKPKEMSSVFD